MPTYVCQTRPEKLTTEQKDALADAICKRHSEATGAPIYLVQVVIDESEQATRYLGPKKASKHIWIRADIRSGRSKEARESLIRNIASDTSRIAGISTDEVWIYLCNLEPTDMLEYGQVLPQPGLEQEWFDNLPDDLKLRLSDLGKHTKFTL